MTLYRDIELYQALTDLDIVEKKKLDEIYSQSRKSKHSLSELLLDANLLTDANLGKVIADLVSLPYVRLSETPIDESVLFDIPYVYAKEKRVIAFRKDREGLHLAMQDPTDIKTKEFIEKKEGEKVIVYLATQNDIDEALNLYSKDVSEAFEEIIKENVELAKTNKKHQPPIIKIVNTTIKYAYQNKASDIHIEPIEDKSLIRFRIDGVLHDIYELPAELHPQIVTRIKVLSDLRTDEHQAAQDGKISYKSDEEELDIRVSIVPITDGEKVVMRLLSERSRQFSLVDLGFSEHDLKKVEDAYKKPHGMILSTGPTGSGKTTTLYSILKLLNRRDVNIMTIEDPVEYDIEGVNQIQVNAKTGLNFSSGLRSIVRQDPDIILVGEIRDEETADISVNAAMTGHLVLSTLHTNDAATSIPRLIDLSVEPFLIASTVNLIIAQRLVRKICENCRVSVEVDKLNDENVGINQEMLAKYLGTDVSRVYKGKGCSLCHGTGYLGRNGIYEVLIVNSEIREAIDQQKDAEEIKEIAVKSGMQTMIENGFEKVKAGVTTVEEVLRVIKD